MEYNHTKLLMFENVNMCTMVSLFNQLKLEKKNTQRAQTSLQIVYHRIHNFARIQTHT